jgi:hypothetical protein
MLLDDPVGFERNQIRRTLVVSSISVRYRYWGIAESRKMLITGEAARK